MCPSDLSAPTSPEAGAQPDSDLLLSYPEAASAGPAIVGGKGWSLGRLARYGFAVPDGAVLAAEAYRQHLAAARVDRQCAALAQRPAEAADTPETVAQLDAIRAAVEATPLPGAVVEAVAALLEQDRVAGRPIAVRSSATAEDSAEASFAGIHESVLNVVGLDATLDAIRHCYAALWTTRALAYRRRLGIADDGIACAVVLCAMVGRAGDVGRLGRPGCRRSPPAWRSRPTPAPGGAIGSSSTRRPAWARVWSAGTSSQRRSS
jgi:pyruvate,water dikinase